MQSIRVLEPRVNIKSDVQKNHLILYGGSRVNHVVNNADSSQLTPTAPTDILFSISPPSSNTIVDRYLKIRAYMEITTNAPHQLGSNDALRAFPLNSLIQTTSVEVNGMQVSDRTSDKLHAKMCYGVSNEELNRSISTSPVESDQFQEYSDWQNYGSSKSPLSNFGEAYGIDPRGGFVVEVISPTVFRCVVTEPLLISPFFNGVGNQEEGMTNVDKININLQLKSDLSSVLSHSSAGNAITSVGMTFYQAPQLLTTYITPNMLQNTPSIQVLPFLSDQDYVKPVPSLASGASTQVLSDTIRLSQIPRRIYLFVRHSRATSDFSTSDSFLSIQNVSINWGNETSVLSGASQQDLFEISRRNGCNLSWSQWSKYRGSVLCLDMAKDLGLLDNLASGVRGAFTFQVQMTVRNESTLPFVGEFFQVFQNSGTFSVFENSSVASLGNITRDDVIKASEAADELHYDHYMQLQGGSFFSSLKNIVNKVARGVQSLAPVASMVAGAVAPEFLPVIGGVSRAAGLARGLSGGRLSGGRLSGGKLKRYR